MTYYVGIVDGAGGNWGVRVPDFPGCHGGGATPAEAVKDATLALREFAADMIAGGEPLPEPRDMDAILEGLKSDGEPLGGTVYLPLLLDRHRVVRANISLDAGLLETIAAPAESMQHHAGCTDRLRPPCPHI